MPKAHQSMPPVATTQRSIPARWRRTSIGLFAAGLMLACGDDSSDGGPGEATSDATDAESDETEAQATDDQTDADPKTTDETTETMDTDSSADGGDTAEETPTAPDGGGSPGRDAAVPDAGRQSEPDRLLAPGERNPDSSPFAFDFERVEQEEEIPEITDMQMLPDSNEFLVLTKHGWLMHLELLDGATLRHSAYELLTPDGPLFYSEDDCGGIGLAVAPDFAETRHVYLGGCVSRTYSGLFRLEFVAGDQATTLQSVAPILEVGHDDAERGWHNIGEVAFDRDGNLWTLFGEKTVASQAHDTSNLLGTMVRIVPSRMSLDANVGYDPSPGNPFDGDEARAEIYAYGLRSPWKGFQDNLGRYWVGDVGANTVEELNVVIEGGLDYGWPDAEGPCGSGCDSIDPVIYWVHDDESGYLGEAPRSTRDGVAYAALQYQPNERDPYQGKMDNRIVFGDYRAGFVRVAEVDESLEVLFDLHVGHAINATAWMQGPDGYIYTGRFRSADSIGDGVATLKRAVLTEAE